MNRDKFKEYLDRPETMDAENLEQIREVLLEYPYFQTAHMLLVKTLSNLKDMRFNGQLKVSAAHIGNRNILFNLLHQHHIISKTQPGFFASVDNDPELTSIKENDPEITSSAETEAEVSTNIDSDTGFSSSVETEPEVSTTSEANPVPYDDAETGLEESLADKVLREVEQLKKSKETQKEDLESWTYQNEEPATEMLQKEERTEGQFQKEEQTDDEKLLKDTSDPEVEKNVSLEDSAPDVLLIDDKAGSDNIQESESSVAPEENDKEAESDIDLLELDKSEQEPDALKNQPDKFSGKAEEKKNLKQTGYKDNEAHSFSEWIDLFQAIPLQDEEEHQDEADNFKDDLIDRFLKEKPRIEPRSPLENTDQPVDMSAVSTKENEEFFTETLAKIYIQQKHYKKAIYAYEKLCLKYPEKYGYFADQIDEIKRFINQ